MREPRTRARILHKLHDAGTRFGYFAECDESKTIARLARAAPSSTSLRLVYENLACEAEWANDIDALLGNGPDDAGHGAIGIAALDLRDRAAPLIELVDSTPDAPRLARVIDALADVAVRTHEPVTVGSAVRATLKTPQLVPLAACRNLHAVCVEAPGVHVQALSGAAVLVDRLPKDFTERELAFEAHLRAWESIVPDAAGLIHRGDFLDTPPGAVHREHMHGWSKNIIWAGHGFLTPRRCSRIEAILAAFVGRP